MEPTYTVNVAQYKEIHAHLVRCNASFVPPLDSRVVLADYARKLISSAIRYEAWDGETLIGLVAMYANDPAKREAFITNVSVDEAHGNQGIARKLTEQCIAETAEQGFQTIVLEVSKNNRRAMDLYEKLGFSILAELQGDSVKLALQLA
jgi:ribosomal protein S18 acetylase RimI-like enzyme